MPDIDRRAFIGSAASAALALSLPVAFAQMDCLSPVMAARRHAMHAALAELETAKRKADAFWEWCEKAGIVGEDAFWEWYAAQPSTLARRAAVDRSQAAVEATFMTPPETTPDEDVVFEALEAYATTNAPSYFAAQTAYDLYMPKKYKTASEAAYASIREGLLTDPDEAFKVDIPWFLRDLRAKV